MLDPLGLLDWATLRAVGPLGGTLAGPTGPITASFDEYTVKTDNHIFDIQLLYEESPLPGGFNCHGYTFTQGSYGVNNPFVVHILAGDNWKRSNCCNAEIFVIDSFEYGVSAHSARIVETIGGPSYFDESNAIVESKNGWFIPVGTYTFGFVVATYGGKYKCYTQGTPSYWGCGCWKGPNEAPWW